MREQEEQHVPNYNSVAHHLSRFIKPAEAKVIVKNCIKFLKKIEFDAIAFRGLSGALIAPSIAMEMGKELIAVRKTKGDHSSNMVEGDRNARTYVIVDDFIGSGNTVLKMLDEIAKYAPGAECIGVLQAFYINDPVGVGIATYEELFVTKIVETWKNTYRGRKAAEIMQRKAADEPTMKRAQNWIVQEECSQWKAQERSLQALGLLPLQKALKSAPPEVIAKFNKKRLEQDRENFRARMNIDRQPSYQTTINTWPRITSR